MFQFQTNTTISVSGCTGSGKTWLVYRLLKNLNKMFDGPPPARILFCYGIYQDLFEEMDREIDSLTFHQGLPTESDIDSLTEGVTHSMVILDDMMDQIVKNDEIELLFTRGAHHRGITVLYINQNMFNQGKNARNINLNTHYMILLRSPRQTSQIHHLGQQILPKRSKAVLESYEDCMKKQFGYLLINLSPHANKEEMLMTRIFPDEDPIVYIPI